MSTTSTTPVRYDERKARTQARNQKLCQYINELYNGKQRRRLDDCIALAANQFNLAPATVDRIYAGY